MIQDFKVKTLFKDQIHERQQFTLSFEGATYQGIFHDDNIQWFHPQPHTKLAEEVLKNLEANIYDLMQDHIHRNLQIKPMFEDQVHERQQFKLNFKGDTYQGIFHNEDIQWFHPQPHTKLDEEDIKVLKSNVFDLMLTHINQDFKIKPLFEDQIHERQQFTLSFEGDHYHGIFHDDGIQWFHPQPKQNLEEDDLQDLESKVFDLMQNHIYQDFKVKLLFENQQ
ncbi:DUF5342 family protein [Bacillus cihuensis]|uniref:DUF5342 family protein n=1 Tax=Bacillus cihuensis TaxID=1208599 RepID=UPI000418E361|nr:DUF5342 family protein [Bacillus cihuensis]